jgi:hypothetical protein
VATLPSGKIGTASVNARPARAFSSVTTLAAAAISELQLEG